MFNFDIPRYEKVVGDAIALRPVSYTHLDVYKRQPMRTVLILR